MHGELLRLAAMLASDSGGYPRWVARSRAVSTAYYALFHALAERCARELVGAWQPWAPFRHIYRSLDHGQARRIFSTIESDRGFSEGVRLIAETFIDLQEQRHGADYDIGYRASVVEVAILLNRAKDAIESLDRIEPAARKLVAARLIGRTRSA